MDRRHHLPEVQRAVAFAEQLKIIQVLVLKSVEGETGIRSWAEARYVFPSGEKQL